jgi:hypothetical protein
MALAKAGSLKETVPFILKSDKDQSCPLLSIDVT